MPCVVPCALCSVVWCVVRCLVFSGRRFVFVVCVVCGVVFVIFVWFRVSFVVGLPLAVGRSPLLVCR